MFEKSRVVKVGDKAPDFVLQDSNRSPVDSRDYYGQCPLVIFFYPKDYTPICTLENIAFRNLYCDFVDCGAEVFGISNDPPDSHDRFCDQLNLNFRLLSDPDHLVRDRFGEIFLEGEKASRVTYVINKKGIVCYVYVASLRAKNHAKQALQAVRALVQPDERQQAENLSIFSESHPTSTLDSSVHS